MGYQIIFFIAVVIIFALVGVPSKAMAWGPGVHMVTGNWLLQNLQAVPPDIALTLMRYPGQFLHGCLSADIFIGKGSKPKAGHSHNWESGFNLLHKADSRLRQAYAYGYLAHLAADTVAHNVYVPGTVNRVPVRGTKAHIYLEMQADRLLLWDKSDALNVFKEFGSKSPVAMLRDSMQQKALPFWLKTQLFKFSIVVGGSKIWRSLMGLADKILAEQQQLELLEYMLTLSTRAMVSIISEKEDSTILQLDPIGARALAEASAHRSEGNLLLRGMQKIILPSFIRKLDPHGPVALYIPEILTRLPVICTTDPASCKADPASCKQINT